MGIGLCLQCLGDVMAMGDAAPMPEFGVTFAPMLWPAANPMGMVAVPACWKHLSAQAEQVTRKPLLVANGRLG